MTELNKLTQRLFAEGYTKSNYPEWVNPFREYDGGFTYKREYLGNMVFSTPCGLFLKYYNYFSSGYMSYMGIDWTIENDCPTINCPYRKEDCQLNHELLRKASGGGLSKIVYCACHLTNKPYEYEKSVDKVRAEQEQEKQRIFEEFKKSKNGRVCRNHCYFNEWDKTWRQHYDPLVCARNCYNNEFCPIQNEPIPQKKANVYYDLKITRYRHEETLFDGQKTVSLIKGKKLLGKPCATSICENIVKLCSNEILHKEKDRLHHEMFLNPDITVEVMNVRTEMRESRDLMQDLRDIADGIEVTHMSDIEKIKKAAKKQRKETDKQKKVEKLKEKILKTGFAGLDTLDKMRVEKLMSDDDIEELENLRIAEQSKTKPQQLSLF
jgi:hypothetical protein